MKTTCISIGVVGCGAVAQFAHLPALARTERVIAAALCDTDRDLLAKVGARWEVPRLYERFEDLLGDARIDAVLIAVPDAHHVQLARMALETGKHVLVEKPLGLNSAECRQLVTLVERSGLVLQVGNMKRHDAGVEFARRFITERIGPLLAVSGVYRDTVLRHAMQASCLDRLITSTTGTANHRRSTGDKEAYNLWTQGAHLFDMLEHLGGEVHDLTAQSSRAAGQTSWHGLLDFTGGACGHFELTCKSCGEWHEQYTVLGEHGSVEVAVYFPFYHRPAKARVFDGRTKNWTEIVGSNSNAYVNQLEDFARCITDGVPPNPSAKEGLKSVQMLEAISRSLSSHSRVAVECEA